ncbi:MAG: phenylalanine--tRNA ligase subunit beta, partial [Candidatus Marinimicrobia bacterium]|nr:phenylalanine--tRNA ligase subunit beta [Candidatus Neomarinimicrobiota bacterium]
MKVSLHWLKRFVDFDLNATQLADQLTMRGFESEVVTDFNSLDNVVVGDVLSAQKHPDADKLKLCTVSDGNEEFSVVCGAPNVDKGQKIVFAKVGAILPGDFKIGKAKIRGVESFGMICSERELGISEEHDGIMVLDNDAKTGSSIKDILGPIYNAIDIEVTPDKAFALSHRGIAREVAAMLGTTLKTPLSVTELSSNTKDNISIELDKKSGCTRYMAGVMKGVKVGPSPKWLADYLKSVGQKSINNLVDISNFMLLEIGHPTHIFDLKKLSTPAIKVAWAKKGEKFHALDDETYILESDHMVITDTKNTIALAGIIGGMDSAVSDDTSEVLIESAYFDPVVIRKGSKKLNLLSEASRRFERGTDPNAINEAFNMIVQLMQEVAGGTLESLITDECSMSLDSASVKLSSDKLMKYAGQVISDKEVEAVLDGLHIKS